MKRDPAPRLRHVPALDGIRGLSIAAVLLFHGDFDWASGGYLGVSTFFTLSGFLITFLLVSEREATGGIRLAAFWDRRFRRLMPAALLCLAGMVPFAVFVADEAQLWRLRADALSALCYVANWRFMLSGQAYENLFAAPSPLQHFWSLAIEEQFYLAYPPLVAGLLALGRGSRRPLWIVMGAMAVASSLLMLALTAWGQSNARVYYGTDTRAAELLIGALLALAMRRWPLPDAPPRGRLVQVLGGAGLLFSSALWFAATPHSRWLFLGGLPLYAIASACVIAAALQPGPVNALLAWRPMRWLGRISYGVYLYHWPVFLWLAPERIGLGEVPVFAIRVGVTLGLAALSFTWLELPIRRGRLRVDRRVWLALPASAALVAGLVLGVTRDLPVNIAGYRSLPHAMPAVNDADTAPRILVLGDSLAYNLGGPLQLWSAISGKASVWNQGVYGCGIARGGTYRFYAEAATHLGRDCDRWVDWWPIQLERFRPQATLVLTGIWDLTDRSFPEWGGYQAPGDASFDAWLLAEYQVAADLIASHGIWVNHPCIRPKKREGPLSDDGGVSQERIDYLNHIILPRLAESRPGLALVDLDRYACPDGEFQSRVGRDPDARPDGVHFSRPAGRWLAGRIGAEVLRALGDGSGSGSHRWPGRRQHGRRNATSSPPDTPKS